MDIAKENSLYSWFKLVKPTITEKQFDVLKAISEIEPCTMHQVADHLKTRLNKISGRFSELRGMRLIVIVAKQNNKSLFMTKQTLRELKK